MVKKNLKTEITSVRFDKNSKVFMKKFNITGADIFNEGLKVLKKKNKK